VQAPGAQQWQEEWQQQAREVGNVHMALKSGLVRTSTATAVLHAEHVTSELQRKLSSMEGNLEPEQQTAAVDQDVPAAAGQQHPLRSVS
jgi:hypothetical protein